MATKIVLTKDQEKLIQAMHQVTAVFGLLADEYYKSGAINTPLFTAALGAHKDYLQRANSLSAPERDEIVALLKRGAGLVEN